MPGALGLMGVGSVPAVATFDPTTIAWTGRWKADLESYADNDPVGTVTDQSGAGRNLAQATAAKKPTYKDAIVNGKAVYRLDGVDDDVQSAAALSSFISASAFTLFAVFKPSAITSSSATWWANHGLLIGTGDTWGIYLSDDVSLGGPDAAACVNYDGSADVAPQTLVVGSWNRIEMRHEGGTLYSRLNGGNEVSVASGDTSLSGSVWLGRSGGGIYSAVDVAEMAVTDVALSLSDRDGMDDYAVSEYGL